MNALINHRALEAGIYIANAINTPQQRRAMFAKLSNPTAATASPRTAAAVGEQPGVITPMPPGARGRIIGPNPGAGEPRPIMGGPDWQTPPPVTPPGRPPPPSAGTPIQEPKTRQSDSGRAASIAPQASGLRSSGTGNRIIAPPNFEKNIRAAIDALNLSLPRKKVPTGPSNPSIPKFSGPAPSPNAGSQGGKIPVTPGAPLPRHSEPSQRAQDILNQINAARFSL